MASRQIKSRAEIDAWMTKELSKQEDCSGSTLTVKYALQSPDSDGCNWSADCHLVAGQDTDIHQAAPFASRVVAKARSLFNMSV